jgi:hypothetical protein
VKTKSGARRLLAEASVGLPKMKLDTKAEASAAVAPTEEGKSGVSAGASMQRWSSG